MTYDVAGRDSLARVTYEQAFRLDTTHTTTIDAIIQYYYTKGDAERMLDYEEHMFRSNNLTTEEKLNRLKHYTASNSFYANNYIRLGALIQRLVIDYPNNRDVANAYAQHMIACGNYEQALEFLRRHLTNKDTTAEDYIYLIQFERFLERDDLVDIDLKAALERFPDDVSLLSFYGYLLLEKGDDKVAIAIFKGGIKRATTDDKRSELWGNIGDAHHNTGDDKRAFKAYKKALDYNPNNILVLNNYAYYMSLEGRELERALEMSYIAMSAEPNNASYVDTYAWILHLLGRNDEAKRYMRQALTLSSQRDASLLCHYADILWALGERFMAETYWQKAVENGYDEQDMQAHIEEMKLQSNDR
jgi:Flp pilus assembly protein TadD